MLRLKDRQKQIPNGYTFYLPEIKWHAPGNFPSFSRVCDLLQQAVNANPFVAQQHQWPTTRQGIEEWVDLYNATVCARMGWMDYIVTDTGGSVPKSQPQHQQATLQSLASAAAVAKRMVSGAKTLFEWVDSNEPPVAESLSTHRAIICSQCPKNEKGDWTSWFTTGAAELIKRKIEKAAQRKLTTPRDDQLNFCSACNCPLRLKVHVPIDWIVKRESPETREKLKQGKDCWIIAESP